MLAKNVIDVTNPFVRHFWPWGEGDVTGLQIRNIEQGNPASNGHLGYP